MISRKLYFEFGDSETPEKYAMFENGRLTEYETVRGFDAFSAGSVFLGRVSEYVRNTGAAFVELGDNKGGSVRGFLRSDSYRAGDFVTVQIRSLPEGNKLYRLSDNINIGGRLIVLLSGTRSRVNISSKITDPEQRNRLGSLGRELIDSSKGTVQGIILRTDCAFVSDEEIKTEFESLASAAERIRKSKEKAVLCGNPCLLYSRSFVEKALFRYPFSSVPEIHSDRCDVFPDYLKDRIVFEKQGFFESKGIDAGYSKISGRTVMLDCGGNIVIDRTEAMTVIDVNSAGSVSGKNRAEYILNVNREAASEIARQLRLRKITGIVVCDFINMEKGSDESEILALLNEKTADDPAEVTVCGFTKLKMLEIVRSKGVFS